MQTLRKGTWKGLPTRKQRWLAAYTLAFPYTQALLGIYFVFALATIFAFKVPVLVALVSYLPVLALLANLLSSEIGLYEFTRAHGLAGIAHGRRPARAGLDPLPARPGLRRIAGRADVRCAASTPGRKHSTWARTAEPPTDMTAEPTEVTRRAA